MADEQGTGGGTKGASGERPPGATGPVPPSSESKGPATGEGNAPPDPCDDPPAGRQRDELATVCQWTFHLLYLLSAMSLLFGFLWHHWPHCDEKICKPAAGGGATSASSVLAGASVPAPVGSMAASAKASASASAPLALASVSLAPSASAIPGASASAPAIPSAAAPIANGSAVPLQSSAPNPGASGAAPKSSGGVPERTAPAAAVSGSAPPPLAITGVAPASGDLCGNDNVVIGVTGLAAEGDVEVRFGGLQALQTQPWQDRSHVTVRTPPHAEGPIDVTVMTKGQSAGLAKAYDFTCATRSQGHLLLLVALAGALGATLHGLRSFTYFLGNRNLKQSWLPWYIALPFMGAAMGTVFFLVFLGGLFSVETVSGKSFFVMIGVAVVVGMFSQEAVEKLKQIAQAVLTPPPKSNDQGPAPEKLVVAEVIPPEGAVTGKESVKIIGNGFTTNSTVTFGTAAVVVKQVHPNCLAVETPAGSTKGKVDVEVKNPDGQKATLTSGFEYK